MKTIIFSFFLGISLNTFSGTPFNRLDADRFEALIDSLYARLEQDVAEGVVTKEGAEAIEESIERLVIDYRVEASPSETPGFIKVSDMGFINHPLFPRPKTKCCCTKPSPPPRPRFPHYPCISNPRLPGCHRTPWNPGDVLGIGQKDIKELDKKPIIW